MARSKENKGSEDIDFKIIVNQLWHGFNILRGAIPSQDLHVFFYLFSAYEDGLIDLEEFNQVSNPYGYLKGALKSEPEYDELYDHYSDIINSIPFHIIVNIFRNLENIDWDNFTGYFLEIFDILLNKYFSNEGNIYNVSLLPSELSEFTNKLAVSFMSNSKMNFVFNPFAGFGTLAPKTSNYHYEGIEANSVIWALGKLRLLRTNHIESHSLKLEDSIKNWRVPNKKDLYNLVISRPPYGKKVESIFLGRKSISKKMTAEQYVIEKGLDSIDRDGLVMCIASEGILFRRGSEANLREYLVENNLLHTVVYFPGGILQNTGIAQCLLILSKKRKGEGNIRMVDATNFVKANKNQKILDYEGLFEIFKENTSNTSLRFVSKEEIRRNDYILRVQRYFLDEVEGVKLSELTECKAAVKSNTRNNKESFSKDKKGVFLRIRDLKNDPFDYQLDPSKIDKVGLPKYVKKYQGSALLLAKIGGILKPTYIDLDSDEESYFVSNDIIVLDVIKDRIRIEFLINELHSDYVLEQIKAFSSGTAFSSISINDILNIKIVLPGLREQDAKVQGAKTSYLQSISREIKLKEELLGVKKESDRSIKSFLHTMRQYLNALKTNVGGTSLFIEKNGSQGISLETLYSKNLNQTLGEHFTSLEETIVSMAKLLDSFENKGSSSRSEILKLSSLVKEAQKRFKNPNRFKFEEVYIDHDAFASDFGYLDQFIEINKEDFFKVFSNIICNAVDHGFTDKDKKYSIRSSIFNNKEKNEFILEISNNGQPMPKEFTYMDLITRGEKSTTSRGTGTGGSDIKDILSNYDVYFELITDDEDEYPVKYVLHFPVRSSFEEFLKIDN
ncbi:N-6 DNA methylase [Gaetbulibacter aestuarii]|uniref:site-specific DNA-methyltransferase (adenine-specific) n=1 Tax=Gaetbulibacter aestuarii TaxID=1502358 RepID=A0ABW7N177_9FLAO